MTEHDRVLELLPAFVFGSLDEGEAVIVAGHLAACEVCRLEQQAYQAVVDELALTLPAAAPSPALLQRLMARLERSATAPSTLPGAAVPPGLWPGFWQRGGLAWSVISLLLIVGLGLSNIWLWQRVNGLTTVAPTDQMQAVLLNSTAAAPQASGYLLISAKGDRGALVVDDLPLLPPDSAYQLWLIRDGQRTSGALFSVDEAGYGLTWITAPDSLFSYSEFGVSIEPSGGSPGPTGVKVLSGAQN